MKRGPKPTPVLERLMAKMDVEGDCWLWQGSVNNKGYGQIHNEGKTVLTHRVAWELFHREPLGDQCVLHKCDTPRCFYPGHLFLGTQKDNTDDMVAKGRARGPAGEKSHTAKLTADDVRKIRSMPNRRGLVKWLAQKYDVNRRQIWLIRSHKNWKEVH